MRRRRRLLTTVSLALAAAGLAACGDTVKLPEAPTSGSLTAASVRVQQTGNAPATVDTSSATFQLDDSGSLVVHVRVTSTASAPQTIAIRASLFDANGNVIGDATGGSVNVAPGSTSVFELNGPAPIGTIASATFEVTALASPTPTNPVP